MISEELQRLKLKRRPLSTRTLSRTLSTKRVRAARDSRLKFRAKSSSAEPSSSTLGVQRGEFLSVEQQTTLCSKWQAWQRVQKVLPPNQSPRAEFMKAWAAAAQMSEAELAKIEAEGPLAAHLLLASVERLLYQISRTYNQPGSDLEDVMAEARMLWLEAAAQCDFSRASLNSFGTMFLKQRLPRIVDRQRSLLDQPSSSIYDEIRVVRVRDELEGTLAREPTIAEIAAEAKMTKKGVENVLKRLKSTVSLDTPVQSSKGDSTTSTLGDNLAGDITPDLDKGLNSELKTEMEETLAQLMDKNVKKAEEREVCQLYYGFNQEEGGMTMREISAKCDISPETVRKRLHKARAHLNKNGDFAKQMTPYIEEGVMTDEGSESTGRIVDLSAQTNNFK